jgi:integrase
VGDRMALGASDFDRALESLAIDLAGRWVSEAQARRVVELGWLFRRFCEQGFGVSELGAVDASLAAAFVQALTPAGTAAGASLQRARRAAVRELFRCGRRLELVDTDPTVDLPLPPLTSLRARPLADDEVLAGRTASQWALGATRRATTWALAEATCRSGEIARICVGDLDLDGATVRISGGGRAQPRVGDLTRWGQEQIARRLDVVGSDPEQPLVYEGSDARLGGLVSANSAITQVLERAGLGDEPDVRPSSVVAWAGSRILRETGRIDAVAEALGLQSLDRAAEFIGWDWRNNEAIVG